jgi:ABC-type multidrug transport system fused ATPase/permease subunit
MGAYARLLRYVSEIKRELAVKVLFSLLISAAYLTQAAAMAVAVSRVWNGGAARDLAVPLAVAFLSIITRGFLSRELETYGKVMGARVKAKLRMLVFDKILRLGPGYMSAKRSGKVGALALDGIESLEPFLINYVPQIITVIISGVAVGAYLCLLDVTAGLIVLVSMALCVVVPYVTVPLINRGITSYWSVYSVLTAQYVDTIQGMTTLKSLGAAEKRGAELRRDATEFYKQAIRNTGISLLNSGIMLILTSVTSGVTVVVAAMRADIGIMPVTAVPAFLFLAAECARPMAELNRAWHGSFLGLSVARELFELINAEPDVAERENSDKNSLDNDLPSVELRNVSFSYSGNAETVKNVSLSVAPGSSAAVVGRSGSGKTTVLNLLLRFYDVSGGQILINGTDIRDYSIKYLRSKIAVVFQDSFLFGGTIAENIRMAKPDTPLEDIIAAASAANAHGFISEMPDGYDTIVGERGVTLSGGQRQRIAIARAILKDAPILLLDEATSSVDAESESLIQSALYKLSRNRTTITIAHRLSTVRDADEIFVLDEGELAESGTHSELVTTGGIYAALIQAQNGGEAIV